MKIDREALLWSRARNVAFNNFDWIRFMDVFNDTWPFTGMMEILICPRNFVITNIEYEYALIRFLSVESIDETKKLDIPIYDRTERRKQDGAS